MRTVFAHFLVSVEDSVLQGAEPHVALLVYIFTCLCVASMCVIKMRVLPQDMVVVVV